MKKFSIEHENLVFREPEEKFLLENLVLREPEEKIAIANFVLRETKKIISYRKLRPQRA